MVPAVSRRISRVPRYSGYQYQLTLLPVRGFHPLWPAFPYGSGSIVVESPGPTTPQLPQQLWFGLFPLRSPLLGESLICFLLLRVLRCFSSPRLLPSLDDMSSTCRVAPFGYLRIKSYLQIPGASRSLSRPSSPLRAKASAVRPYLLSCSPESSFRCLLFWFPICQ